MKTAIKMQSNWESKSTTPKPPYQELILVSNYDANNRIINLPICIDSCLITTHSDDSNIGIWKVKQ